MQFIKTYWISLLSGVLGLAFIAAAALGMMSEAVEQEMAQRVRDAGQIQSLMSAPKNEAIIQAERSRGEQFERAYNRALEEAYKINRREPLIPRVFPKPVSALTTPFDFIEAYQNAAVRLRVALDAGMPPTEAEIEAERINIEEQQRLEELAEGEEVADPFAGGEEAQRSARNRSPIGGGRMPGGAMGGNPMERYARMGGGRMGGAPMGGRMGGMNLGGRSRDSDEDPKYDPQFRAAVKKARAIRMYADPDAFHITDIIFAEQAPEVADLWFAQMSLWIQQDIVNAIADLNEQTVREAGVSDPYVEHVPVKRLEELRVLAYNAPSGPVGFPPPVLSGGGSAGAQVELPESFTGRQSDDEFDVIVFRVVLWVDQRYLPRIIDALSRANFYQCVDLDYEAAGPENLSPIYMFGADPVVRATFDFEGYFSRTVFKKWMPPSVREMLGIAGADEDSK